MRHPCQVFDIFDVKIDLLGKHGDGLVKKQGYVIIVPNTKVGDEVRIKITMCRPNVAFAEIVEKLNIK